MSKQPACLTAALQYLERGWCAIPCCPPQCTRRYHSGTVHPPKSSGKVPLLMWRLYQWKRPTAEEVCEWWQFWPLANVGIILGPVSGMIGVDIDGPEGEEMLKTLLPEGLPPSLGFRTQSGGRRILYSWPPDIDFPRGTTIETEGRSLSFLVHQFTVMPPSTGRTGNAYVWDERAGEDLGGLVQVPDNLQRFLIADRHNSKPCVCSPALPVIDGDYPDNRLKRARGMASKYPPSVSGQGGSKKTFALACALVHGLRLTDAEAFDVLWREYNPRCEPLWSEKELQHKIRSARERGHHPPIPERPYPGR